MQQGNILHILFDEPLIAYVRLDQKTGPSLDYLARLAGGRPFHVMLSPSWTLTAALPRYVELLKTAFERHPRLNAVILAPDAREKALSETAGLETIEFNHNAFLDENVIYPENASPAYDAVHVARLNPFKRHHLAYEVENIAVLSAKFGVKLDVAADLLSGYRHLAFANFDAATGVDLKSQDEVRGFLSRSGCGLALSYSEGAMYAAGEYGLAGLPIVSTPSIGGRDVFFDPLWTKIVEPDPIAVRDAVRSFRRSAPSRTEVRNGTLALMKPHRERIIDWLSGLTGRDLHPEASETGWLPQFAHRMHTWHNFAAASDA